MPEKPVAIVTGASRGIGAAAAAEFARRGYDVALVARGAKGLEETAGLVRAAGGEPLVLAGDLADLVFAERAVRDSARHFGRIDALVNNAAWREILTMRQITVESWEKTLRVCLTAPAFMARWAAEAMILRKKGVIINVSSVQSRRASGFAPAYIAAKGGLDALTYDLAATYGHLGLRAVAINPGAIDTEMSRDYPSPDAARADAQLRRWSEDAIPLGRWGTAAEVAKTIVWLASDDAAYVTGTTIVADGGLTTLMMPHSVRRTLSPEQYP